MSEETTESDVDAEAPQDDAPSSRIAGAIVALILTAAVVLGVWALVTAFPYVAYFAAGAIAAVAVQRAAKWARRRRVVDDEEPGEQEPPDVGEALRALGAGGHHVLLTGLRKRLGLADTKTVRKLLKAEGIRVREGVRAPAGNGPGVHIADIPAAPPETNDEHGDGCCCRSANNTNANNDQEDPSQKGLVVETIGEALTIIRDPAETQQRQTRVSDLVDRFFAGAEQAQQKEVGKS